MDAGASTLKPVRKRFWGYGGVVRAPDGTVWKIATSSKEVTGPATREVKDVVLPLGCADVLASRRFYVEQGLEVARSFGRRYVEFAALPSGVKQARYGRRALAKDVGVAPQDGGAHGIVIGGAGPFADPDGFAWEPARELAAAGSREGD